MSSDFKTRFMDRMEHITRSGQTTSQQKQPCMPSSLHNTNTNTTNAMVESGQSSHNTSNKLTAQEFQNYLSHFSPPLYSYDNNDYFNDQRERSRQETQSEKELIFEEFNMNKGRRMKANSARANRKDFARKERKNERKRQVSLEFSKKPRKIQYKPYTLNDLHSLAPVSKGTMTLGPNLEDTHHLQRTKNYQKVRVYAELVNSKNKQHIPKPITKQLQQKSKNQIAKEYAHIVNSKNKEKLNKPCYTPSPHFKMTASAALSSYHSANHSKAMQMKKKITELHELHIRNKTIAQSYLQ